MSRVGLMMTQPNLFARSQCVITLGLLDPAKVDDKTFEAISCIYTRETVSFDQTD